MANLSIPESYRLDHLFLLVGTEALVNYISVRLLLKEGGQLYLIHSDTTRYLALYLSQSLRQKGELSVKSILVSEQKPADLFHITQQYMQTIPSHDTIGLDYTGGTKSMSVHAYQAFRERNAVLSYIDIRAGEITIAAPLQALQTFQFSSTDFRFTIEQIADLNGMSLIVPVNRQPVLTTLASKLAVDLSNPEADQDWREWLKTDRKETIPLPTNITLDNFSNAILTNLKLTQPSFTLYQISEQTQLTPQRIERWLDGEWLEHYVLDLLYKIKEKGYITDAGLGISFSQRSRRSSFEIDIVVVQGYRLFLISCTTAVNTSRTQAKVLEILENARRFGGSTTYAGLISLNDRPESLEEQFSYLTEPTQKPMIFGRPHLANLERHLIQWFESIAPDYREDQIARPEYRNQIAQYTMTLMGVNQVHKYIFNSNRLAENIGSIQLIERVRQEWLYESLPILSNVENTGVKSINFSHMIEENNEIQAEVLYTDDTHIAILFKNQSLAHEFTKQLSRKALIDAPGLELLFVHQSLDWQLDSLTEVLNQMHDKMARKKQSYSPSLPLLGLGVTRACASTGLVATDINDVTDKPISREIKIKLEHSRKNWGKKFLDELEIPREFEDIAQEEGTIAVVCIHANDIERRLEDILYQYPRPIDNRTSVGAIRTFSANLKAALENALQVTVDHLLRHWKKRSNPVDGPTYVPFRPLFLWGDDVSFVCAGNHSLTLAATFLRAFEYETSEIGTPMYACAGVTIAKPNVPFAHLHRLSQSLCINAGRYVTTIRRQYDKDCSAIDWHFARGNISAPLTVIRQNEYTTKYGDLTMRPVLLNEHETEWRTWPNFWQLFDRFTERQNMWHDHRSKVKDLQERLRQGPNAVEIFLHTHQITFLPDVASGSTAHKTGWHDNRCVYYDAIEALDYITNLEE